MPKKPFAKAPIVRLQGQPVLLFTEQQGSLLQALETKKVNIFAECRNGFCGACKTKIISGTVCYSNEPLAELDIDECLPCCCIPTSDLDLDLSPEGATLVTYASSKPTGMAPECKTTKLHQELKSHQPHKNSPASTKASPALQE